MRSMALLLGTLAAIAAAPTVLADGGTNDLAKGGVAANAYPVPSSVDVRTSHDWQTSTPTAAAADAVLVGGPGTASPTPCGPCRVGFDDCGNKRWGLDVWLGGWLWAQNGTVGVNGREADVDTSLSDSLDLFKNHGEASITGGARVSYGRCFLNVWASYIRVSGGGERLVTGEPVDVEFKGLTMEATVGYRVNEITLGCSPCSPCLAIDPYIGARYNGMETSFSGPNTSESRKREWWDPIVGCGVVVDFRNGWSTRMYADVGGFGVESDLTWSVKADVGYMFSRHVGVFTGIAAIHWNYDKDGFKFDLTQWGPYIGFVFSL